LAETTSCKVSSARSGEQRLESLDILRGLVVAGMLLVNFSLGAAEYLRFLVAPTLLHSAWAGFTVADAVFPAFLFIVGLSIAAATRPGVAASRSKVLRRAARLFALGFLLSNVTWLWMHDWSPGAGLRIMGVLQRIALCYCAASLLSLRLSQRTTLALALASLLLYWPITLLPIPDGAPTNLAARGMNFVSWVDRALLGPYRYVGGADGYDSEGLLSTVPAIAQCLLGVVAGRWFMTRAGERESLVAFALAGVACAATGVAWARYFPLVKDLWTSSFVLLSSGICMVILALIQLLLSSRRLPRWLARFLAAFGRNAILAYAIYLPGLIVLALPLTPAAYRALSSLIPPEAASLMLAAAFMLLIWIPMAALQRRGRYVRI